MRIRLGYDIIIITLGLCLLSATELSDMRFVLTPYGGRAPASNSIGDISYDPQVGYLWVGTASRGVSSSNNNGISWSDHLEGLGTSGLISAYGVVIVACANDTTVSGRDYPKGNGFRLTRDNGATWSVSEPENASVIGRLAYDVVLVPTAEDTVIWAPCFYGGLLRSDDWMESWYNVFMDTADTEIDFQDLSHRFFSFTADTSTEPATLWAGTASGLYRSEDGGIVWEEFDKHDGLTGNWIVALAVSYTDSGSTIWASTRKALGEDEYDGVSYKFENDTLWHHLDDTLIVWNFGFCDEYLLLATSSGLYRATLSAPDSLECLTIEDYITGFRVEIDEVISVARGAGGRLWAGTHQGLAYSDDCGNSWRVLGTFVEPEESEPTYPFPSPFSPHIHKVVSFVLPADITNAHVEIYDYTMALVKRLQVTEGDIAKGTVEWDGTNSLGEFVANGIYFYRIGHGSVWHWSKVVIIK